MGRYRVSGPYRHYKRWRIVLRHPDGTQVVESFESESEAKEAKRRLIAILPGMVTMESVITKYERHLEAKGNKPRSIGTTIARLRNWHESAESCARITPRDLAKVYRSRAKEVSVDTHRNELAEVKTFWRWLMKKRFVLRSPAEGVEPVGRRRAGKKQLRLKEAQRFARTCQRLATEGDESALAALMILYLGLRSNEVRSRRDRDVDGNVLWIDEGKTAAASRRLEMPEHLAALIPRREGYIFPAPTKSGYRTNTWLRKNLKRLCKLANVPYVCPHGLRGTQATLAEDAGETSHAVSRALGHTETETTRRHYLEPGTRERARTKRAMRILDGGK